MSDLRTAALSTAEFLEELEANMLRNNADMAMDPSNAPTAEAAKLRAALAQPEGEPTERLREIVDAFDAGAVRMESNTVGQHAWHEEWLHHARKTIEDQGTGPATEGGGGKAPAPDISVGADDGRQKTGGIKQSAPAPTTECPNQDCARGSWRDISTAPKDGPFLAFNPMVGWYQTYRKGNHCRHAHSTQTKFTCRRYPPQISFYVEPHVGQYDRSGFPEVSLFDSCGEWAALKVEG